MILPVPSQMPGRGRAIAGAAVSLLLVTAVAVFGSRFMPGAWYAALAKPSWTPPGWVFGPVWTTLYLLMAWAAWLVWRRGGEAGGRPALACYGVQLVLNALWSWIFFGRHAIGAALADLALLWLAILATLLLFWRVRRLAGLLLVPYLAWVTMAGFLNHAVWRLNP